MFACAPPHKQGGIVCGKTQVCGGLLGGRKRPTVVFRRLVSVSITSELWFYKGL